MANRSGRQIINVVNHGKWQAIMLNEQIFPWHITGIMSRQGRMNLFPWAEFNAAKSKKYNNRTRPILFFYVLTGNLFACSNFFFRIECVKCHDQHLGQSNILIVFASFSTLAFMNAFPEGGGGRGVLCYRERERERLRDREERERNTRNNAK